jgi:hypothetical protein
MTITMVEELVPHDRNVDGMFSQCLDCLVCRLMQYLRVITNAVGSLVFRFEYAVGGVSRMR